MISTAMGTTVSVPNNGTILLGGLADGGGGAARPFAATQSAAKPAPGHLQALYLLVKPTIIVERPPAQEQFPNLKSKLDGKPEGPKPDK